jgi:hypothetical protein
LYGIWVELPAETQPEELGRMEILQQGTHTFGDLKVTAKVSLDDCDHNRSESTKTDTTSTAVD